MDVTETARSRSVFNQSERFWSGDTQPIVFNFPLDMSSPGLLTDPAAPPLTVQNLKRRQVCGLVVQCHEAAWTQKGNHPGCWKGVFRHDGTLKIELIL